MATNSTETVPPAVLPNTPKSFTIPAEKLIERAEEIFLEDAEMGIKDPDVLAPDFKFDFPIIKLDKKKYVDTVSAFDLTAAFPNKKNHTYDWRVDPYEPNRVWWTVRGTGTHTGTLNFFGRKLKPTGRKWLSGPECHSFTFNEEGKVTSFTGGYVMDNRVGNTNRLGALYGILASIGFDLPHPQPGTVGWQVGCAVDSGMGLARKVFHLFTLGLFKQKQQ